MSVKIPSNISKWMDVAVSVAAAAVIFGALQKIPHTPIADLWLKIGLYTECGVFLLYGILYMIYSPVKEEYEGNVHKAVSVGNPALNNVDKMLQDADITPTNLKKLSGGFQRLGTTVNGISDVGDVVESTGDFSSKTKEATAAIGTMATAFNNSANTMASFNNASESARGFHEQVQVLTKNLGSLNTIYELELKESNRPNQRFSRQPNQAQFSLWKYAECNARPLIILNVQTIFIKYNSYKTWLYLKSPGKR